MNRTIRNTVRLFALAGSLTGLAQAAPSCVSEVLFSSTAKDACNQYESLLAKEEAYRANLEKAKDPKKRLHKQTSLNFNIDQQQRMIQLAAGEAFRSFRSQFGEEKHSEAAWKSFYGPIMRAQGQIAGRKEARGHLYDAAKASKDPGAKAAFYDVDAKLMKADIENYFLILEKLEAWAVSYTSSTD